MNYIEDLETLTCTVWPWRCDQIDVYVKWPGMLNEMRKG